MSFGHGGTLKLAAVTTTPEVMAAVPVALLTGGFTERLAKARALGYAGVELMVLQPAALDAGQIRRDLSRAGLEVAAIGSGAVALVEKLTLLNSDPSAEAAARRRLDGLIDFAAAVGAPIVTIGGFRGRIAAHTSRRGEGGPAGPPPPARAYLFEVLDEATTRAAAAGVRLALEPLNRYESDIVNTVTEGLALIQELGRPDFGLLIDTFHANIEEPSIAGSFVQAMQADRLFHVHLGDSNRLPPGKGHIDFAAIVTTLRQVNYAGFLSAELLPWPDPDTAAQDTAQHMSQILRDTSLEGRQSL